MPPLPIVVNDPTISPMRKGQVAPYSGVLFSQPASARIISELNSVKEKVKVEVEKSLTGAVADKQLEIDTLNREYKKSKDILDAQLVGKTNTIVRLEKDLKESEDKIKKIESSIPNRSTWFMLGFAGGVVLTVGVSFAIAYAIK